MVIKRTLYDFLVNSCVTAPPEMGGILGMTGGVVTALHMDFYNTIEKTRAIYEPNTSLLNHQIALWRKNNIIFAGIFHTHPFKQPTLSEGDNQYIKQIMGAMPQTVNSLFFPIIIPKNKIYSYYAERDLATKEIVIYADTIKLI